MPIVEHPEGSAPEEQGGSKTFRSEHRNPFVALVIDEVIAGAAAFLIHAALLMFTFGSEWLGARFALTNAAPAHFMDFVFSWLTAISGVALFTVATIFNFGRFILRQWRGE